MLKSTVCQRRKLYIIEVGGLRGYCWVSPFHTTTYYICSPWLYYYTQSLLTLRWSSTSCVLGTCEWMQIELLHYTVIVLQDIVVIQWPTIVPYQQPTWPQYGFHMACCRADHVDFAVEASGNDGEDGWQWLEGWTLGYACALLTHLHNIVWE